MTQENVGADAVLGAAAGIAGGAIAGAVSAFHTAQSFLSDMMGSAQGSSQKFHVNRENVLQAGKVIQDEAMKLDLLLHNAEYELLINADGSGQVSEDIVSAWNRRLTGGSDSYAKQVRKYVDSLQSLSDQLRATATQYGFTEEEVTTAFGKK